MLTPERTTVPRTETRCGASSAWLEAISFRARLSTQVLEGASHSGGSPAQAAGILETAKVIRGAAKIVRDPHHLRQRRAETYAWTSLQSEERDAAGVFGGVRRLKLHDKTQRKRLLQ